MLILLHLMTFVLLVVVIHVHLGTPLEKLLSDIPVIHQDAYSLVQHTCELLFSCHEICMLKIKQNANLLYILLAVHMCLFSLKGGKIHFLFSSERAFICLKMIRVPVYWMCLGYLWCDQAKWVLCRAPSNFSFVVYLWKHSESFVLVKTSSKSDLRFQRYRQFCVAENNKIQKEFHTIIGCISKSIFPTYDSFRLIASHLPILKFLKIFRKKIRIDRVYSICVTAAWQ